MRDEALPLSSSPMRREWFGGVSKSAGITALVILLAAPALAREPLSDAQIRQAIIQDSIARYQSTGHPCACPDNLARNGSRCGGRSAYNRPGGASPLCFPQDA